MRRAALTTLLISLPLAASLADVYRSVDAQGHVQYSDTPTPGAELIQRGTSSLNTTAAPVTAVGKANSASASGEDPVHARLAKEDAARTAATDESQARAEQCKKAQETYQQSIQSRRMYTVGPDGERQYLSDADADQRRASYRQAMDEACNGVQQ